MLIEWSGNIGGFKRRQAFVGMHIFHSSISITTATPATPFTTAKFLAIGHMDPMTALGHMDPVGASGHLDPFSHSGEM